LVVIIGTTARFSTSQKRAILSHSSSSMGKSERATIMFGEIPIERNSATECWVGLVFNSSVAPM
jgi:hypothetical protein